MNDEDWDFNAPQHYIDLPSAALQSDDEHVDEYFFGKNDDTVFYEPETGEASDVVWTDMAATAVQEEEETFPVIRRRSRSVGSMPIFIRKPEISIASSQSSVFKKPRIPSAGTSKAHSSRTVDDPDQNFVDGLRAYNPVRAQIEGHRITKPVPFNLTEPKRKVTNVTSNPSMAEGVQRWEKKTPERFHTSRHGEVFRMVERFEQRTTTEAHTPHLTAVKRHRTVHAVSREVKEQKEFEEMKKNQFKAHGVDNKVFQPPKLPAKKELKGTTVEPFHLSVSHKKENIAPETEVVDHHFHAKPAPKFDEVNVERKSKPVTVPQTPKFSEAGKASLQTWRRGRSRSNGSLATIRSSSSNGSLSTSTNERLKNTVVEPFSFEVRDKQLQQRREIKIKKALEEERKQHEFHANPCPKFSYSSVPEKPTLIATRPAPFQLSCDTRGKSKHEKFIQQLEELRLEERKATQFKAQPAKILTKEPFKVKLDHTRSAGTDVVEFNLSTTRRAQERKQYDEYLKQREEEMEENKLLREQQRQQREAEEAARLREESTFVANPIRNFKKVDIKKSEPEMLTVPKTPKFMKPK